MPVEFLLDEKNDRESLFPIMYPDFWALYTEMKASFWLPEDIDFKPDLADWDNKLSDAERKFLEMNFAFFSVFDQIVIKNLESDFVGKVAIPEVRMFYRFQEAMEDIHVHTYSLFPDLFIKDQKRKEEIVNATKSFPVIAKMEIWAKKWTAAPFVPRLVAYILVEGVLFNGGFASIGFMKKQGKMPGVAHANELIARDEAQHTKNGILMYSKYVTNKLPKEEIIAMTREAVELAQAFSIESIPIEMIGMKSDLMVEYIQFTADRVVEQLIGEPIFKASNPFPWMMLQSLQPKTNFFDKKVGQYSKPGAMNGGVGSEVSFDADF
jgi:ribonucleotide reductase beta subunit family protein with ferritin-like domain